MVFNSFQFLIFFSIVLPAYWALPLKGQRYLLLLASYLFYMAWRPRYALLIAGISLLDYCVGLGLGRLEARPAARRGLLVLSIAANLGILFVFKYWTFFGAGALWLSRLAGGDWRWPDLDVVIPLGVSFHTFQSLSYAIEVYRRKIPVERSLVNFALFVAFFPQLVAGPIERGSHLLPQFHSRRVLAAGDLRHGLRLVLIGLFKKMVVADNLAPFVDRVYGAKTPAAPLALLLGTYAYAFQIYADFSGYSDIAIGVARMMGYRLMTNFDTPYFSSSVPEFWRRWHISLSTWLRDYLYIPLGGSRHGDLRTYASLMITMLLGGLWHGAAWTFVVWGGLNGLYLGAFRLLETHGPFGHFSFPPSARRVAGRLLTFHLICFSWIYFRSETLARANSIAAGLGGALLGGGWLRATGPSGRELLLEWTFPVVLVLVLLGVDAWAGSGAAEEPFLRVPPLLRYAAYSALGILVLALGVYQANHFIYFQF